MAAFIPHRTDQSINEKANAKVVEDKTREVKDGFDGSWVAHPGLVKVARQVFEKHLNGNAHQKQVMRTDVTITAQDLTNFLIPGGSISLAGVKTNISVCI